MKKRKIHIVTRGCAALCVLFLLAVLFVPRNGKGASDGAAVGADGAGANGKIAAEMPGTSAGDGGCLSERVLRLHVIANSDSEFDQALKYDVRDAVLEEARRLLGGCTTKAEALETVECNRESFLAAAGKVLGAAGAEYEAVLIIGQENYPLRVYEDVAYPAGEYTSVRVVLGDGAGRNWWCVLFPPLCLSAALAARTEAETSAGTDVCLQVGFTPEQYRVITEPETPRYRIRFRLFDMLCELFEQ